MVHKKNLTKQNDARLTSMNNNKLIFLIILQNEKMAMI